MKETAARGRNPGLGVVSAPPCVAEVRCSWRSALTSSSPEGIVTHERRHHHSRPAERHPGRREGSG
jgi:hypothetical protein